ncbi:hypothetical protein RF11_03309 [Thelohanellus kitauei]|uniref:Uncharacterized protein n=1 Tax=Thelohanellus kitauei TaxID=669202 RepID=A0A0C2MNF9_THEKT|nr:hypothetical protein RF11_03309 [Thelohanellus kitauei]
MTRAQVLILSTSSSITGNGSQFPLPGAVEHQTDTLKSMLDNRLLGLEFKSEDFERLKEVGFGSAGVVYHARYSPSDLYLALKVNAFLKDYSCGRKGVGLEASYTGIKRPENLSILLYSQLLWGLSSSRRDPHSHGVYGMMLRHSGLRFS